MEEGMAIEHGMVTRSIERAQKKVEEHNFEIRKHLLEYDEVMDEQRKAIYGLRQKVLEHADLKSLILEMIEDTLQDEMNDLVPTDIASDDRNGRPFCEWAAKQGVTIEIAEWRSATGARSRTSSARGRRLSGPTSRSRRSSPNASRTPRR